MNLQSYLENLRAKPDHIKKRYAFWSSLSFTAVVFAFWISSFSSWGSEASQNVAKTVDKVGTPAQSMIAGVGSFFVDIKDMIFGAKKIRYTSIEVVPGK